MIILLKIYHSSADTKIVVLVVGKLKTNRLLQLCQPYVSGWLPCLSSRALVTKKHRQYKINKQEPYHDDEK